MDAEQKKKGLRWRLKIALGDSPQGLLVEAATCSIERGDRYVFRDERGEWIAEIRMSAVCDPPKAATEEEL
jgi:hypothetical protein